ncbi:hypothetical protein DL93DRAFT_2083787 [Clavulina sp. PMI_390]|nr:hypothetical protein DL93DRAFT_2083787 [Clavulina sp. PMI_390]
MQAKLLQLLAEMPIHDVTFLGTAMDREFIFPMLQALDHVENLHFHQSSKHGKLLDRISQVLERGSTERQLGEHTNSDVNVNLFLPLLHTVSIEEAKGLYWMFWEFPNRLSEPPNWVVRQEQKPKTEGTWKTLKGCDQCKVDKTRCNLLLKQGCSCTRCDDKSLDCKIETNTAVMEARDTQKAMNRLQGLDIKVNWALR